ncbi:MULTISPECIES: fumarylacetoacetate hydrolase family protein [Acetobacter]|uniref:Fumarylpyruvate hydrolase n=1 Tax=Acetobacter senegalensis TaxID=446692 RepID=A0A0U5EXZ2_9PROT|nr:MULTISPECIES: fumarylacetoacetate hydrolase family protein [Acetobacter]MCC6104094.1 fumarylacetoacetate hydrolase family protein [Acetobacter sp.]CEF40961.1 fumarylpyruvate hydrolase [Acetobacter senegalensis]
MPTNVLPTLFPLSVPTLPVQGENSRFPVRRIWCVGQNYAEHSREMGGNPDRDPPFFFSKPADAVTQASVLPFPPKTDNLHPEVELVVAIAAGGANISSETALKHVYGYAVGLDMTRRDLQAVAKKAGRPWSLAKGFDASCPISAIKPASQIPSLAHSKITLTVNGEVRQSGNIDDMIWSIPEIISILSQSVRLEAGDLIMTGTPAGVSRIMKGDVLKAACENVGTFGLTYV